MSSPVFHENGQKFQKWPLFAFFSIFLKNFKNKKNKKYRKKPAIWPRTCIKPRYTNGFRAFFASSKSGHRGHKSGQKRENGHFFRKFHEPFFAKIFQKMQNGQKNRPRGHFCGYKPATKFSIFSPIFSGKKKEEMRFFSSFLLALLLDSRHHITRQKLAASGAEAIIQGITTCIEFNIALANRRFENTSAF